MEVRTRTTTTTEVILNDADTKGIVGDISVLIDIWGRDRVQKVFPNLIQMKNDIERAPRLQSLHRERR
jgi:hypothetical protein